MSAAYEPIGIIATLNGVIELLLHSMTLRETVVQDKLTYYSGWINNRPVVLVRSGAGKVNAALCAATLIKVFAIKCIIMVGMGGALVRRLGHGDIIISEDLIHHDMEATRLGLPPGTIPGLKVRSMAADTYLRELARRSSSVLVGVNVCQGRILTGDQFISDKGKLTFLKTLYNGQCVDMEGAALAQVCLLCNIPFVVIRCIAERTNGKFMRKYKTFSRIAALNLAALVREMINNTSKIPGG